MRLLKRFLGALAVRDVAHQREQEALPAAAEDAHARLYRKRRAVLTPVDARGRGGDAGHHLLPTLAAPDGIKRDVDVIDRKIEHLGAGVAQAIARLLIDIDDTTSQVVNEKRLSRLFNQVAKSLFTLSQSRLTALALGNVARHRGNARGSARARVFD